MSAALHEALDRACAEFDGLVAEPVSVDDCAAIYEAIKRAVDAPIDVVIRGGTPCDRSDRRIEVVVGTVRRTIAITR